MPHLMHFFTITWLPVSAPWNVKILATCVTLIGLVRRDLHIWQDISPGINLDRMMNNHARDNKLTVTGNNTKGLICEKYMKNYRVIFAVYRFFRPGTYFHARDRQ